MEICTKNSAKCTIFLRTVAIVSLLWWGRLQLSTCHRKCVLFKEATYCDVAKSIFFSSTSWTSHQTLVYTLSPIFSLAHTAECARSCLNHQADDVALAHCLMCDNFWQKHISAAISSVYLEQCYDCIAHSIASLGAQCWGIPICAITSLLTTIQHMVFFLWTAHGDSSSF
jgi:hypothetical protein